MRGPLALLLLACSSCGGDRPSVTASVSGRDIVLAGQTSLRGVELEITWPDGLEVEEIRAGADAGRLNLFRVRLADEGGRARVILTDTRKLSLPARGQIVHVEARGEGAITLRSALGADDDGAPVAIEVP